MSAMLLQQQYLWQQSNSAHMGLYTVARGYIATWRSATCGQSMHACWGQLQNLNGRFIHIGGVFPAYISRGVYTYNV